MICPSAHLQMMLHNCDRQVVLLNNNDPKKMYPMDLETGKVVEEWVCRNGEAGHGSACPLWYGGGGGGSSRHKGGGLFEF